MTDKGKEVSRVHVLRSPLTDYLRYELAAYPGNITAGESIGIIDLAERTVTSLPDHDSRTTGSGTTDCRLDRESPAGTARRIRTHG